MDQIVTASLLAIIVLATIGAAALSLLVARYDVTAREGEQDELDALDSRHYFFARLTYFVVAAALTLTAVVAGTGLSFGSHGRPNAPRMTHAESTPACTADVEALVARIAALETTLADVPRGIDGAPAHRR